MRKQNFSLSLPDPCRQNWDKMENAGKGRLCSSCAKVVIDFSTMTEQEIISTFTGSKPGELCGRFRQDQLNNEYRNTKKTSAFPFLPRLSLLLIGVLPVRPSLLAQTSVQKAQVVKTTSTKKKAKKVMPSPGHITLEGNIKNNRTGQGIPAFVRLQNEFPLVVQADTSGYYCIDIPLTSLNNDTIHLAYQYGDYTTELRVIDLAHVPPRLDILLFEPVTVIELNPVHVMMGIPQLTWESQIVLGKASWFRRLRWKIRYALGIK